MKFWQWCEAEQIVLVDWLDLLSFQRFLCNRWEVLVEDVWDLHMHLLVCFCL